MKDRLDYPEAIAREAARLSRRRPAPGWWAFVFDLLGDRAVEFLSIRHLDLTPWEARAYAFVLNLTLGAIMMAVSVLLICVGNALFGSGPLNDEISPIQIFFVFVFPIIFCFVRPFLLYSRPACPAQVKQLNIFLAKHPEFLPVATQWVHRRGFLTEHDTLLIAQAAARARDASRGTEKVPGMALRTTHWIGEWLVEKRRVIGARRDARRAALDGSLLGVHVEAAKLKKDTKLPSNSISSSRRL